MKIPGIFPAIAVLVSALAVSSAHANSTVSFVGNDSLQKLPDLPYPLSNHQAGVFGDYLVVTGGRNRLGKPVAQMLTARIRGNGSFSAWKVETPLPVPLSGHSMVELNGYTYITGGMMTSGKKENVTSAVWIAQLSREGYPGKWRRGTDMPEALFAHAMVSSDGSLYVIGGISVDGFSNSVYKGDVDKDGRITGWKRVLSMPSALAYASAAAINGYLVVAGGQSPGEGKTLIMPTTYIGPLIKDGEPTTWYLASSKLPGAWLGYGRCQAGIVSFNNTIICFGGQDSSWFYIGNMVSTVFNPEKGEVGPWGIADAPKGMPEVSQVARWKDRIFMVGGYSAGRITAKVVSVRLETKEVEEPR